MPLPNPVELFVPVKLLPFVSLLPPVVVSVLQPISLEPLVPALPFAALLPLDLFPLVRHFGVLLQPLHWLALNQLVPVLLVLIRPTVHFWHHPPRFAYLAKQPLHPLHLVDFRLLLAMPPPKQLTNKQVTQDPKIPVGLSPVVSCPLPLA